jgi:ribosome-associated heat shock protein Hsp15
MGWTCLQADGGWRPRSASGGPGTGLDKWLWAARFFKARSHAATAVLGGRVHVNGERVKPAKPIRSEQVDSSSAPTIALKLAARREPALPP